MEAMMTAPMVPEERNLRQPSRLLAWRSAFP